MHNVLRIPLICLAISVLALSQASGSDLTQLNQKEPVSRQPDRGFCCVNGNIFTTDATKCKARKGQFSVSKAEIDKICKPSPLKNNRTTLEPQPSQEKSGVPKTGPVKGYCCSAGRVYASDSSSCEKRRGVFATSKRDAEKKCGEEGGYCCAAGEYKQSTKRNCDRIRGVFSGDRQKGFAACQATTGFCCIKGNVSPLSKGQCEQKKGTFSTTRGTVEKLCQEMAGYCCSNGRVLSANRQACERKKGDFFSDRSVALKSCQQTVPPSKTADRATMLPLSSQAAAEQSLPGALSISPDLVVLSTKLDKECKLKVTVKNQGGPIGEAEHSEAEIYISAGAGNILSPRKRFLRVLDPEKHLKSAGGEATYVTDLQVMGTQSTLVWLDTAHNIAESNEQNNGDDQVVSCGVVAASPKMQALPQSAANIPEKQADPQSVAGGDHQVMGTGPVAKAEVPHLPTGVSTVDDDITMPMIWIIPGPIIPESPQLNQQVTASFTVKNWGSVATSGPLSFNMRIYNTDPTAGSATTVYPWHINDLDPNDEETITLSYTPYHLGKYAASFQILLQGYSGDVVFLGGQTSSTNFLVTQPYDLRVYAQAIELDGSSRLKFAVGNMGPAILLEMYKLLGMSVRLDMGPRKIVPLTVFDPTGVNLGSNFTWPSRSTDPANGLDPFAGGSAREVQLSVGIIKPDGSGLNIGSPDTNPNNNLKYKTLGGRADLVVCYSKQLGSKPNRYSIYRPVVKNIGDAPSDIVNLRFRIEDKGTRNYTIPALSPGEVYSEVSRKVYWVFTGSRYYTLHVDNLQESYGEEWTNNIIRGTITVNTSYTNVPSQCSNEPGMAD